jgi:hypothetical protein
MSLVVDLLDHPEAWGQLAFLAKVHPDGDVLTTHVELFGTEATVTAPIVAGSEEFWTTGFDLAVAVIEDLEAGGTGRVPEIVEAWTFEFGPLLKRLKPVNLPGGWIWDPRRPSSYRSRDGRRWGNLYLLLSAMRIEAKNDPGLSPAARLRRSRMLKVAANSGAFGLWIASTTRDDVQSGTAHRVITSEGVLTLHEGRAEQPGPWAFPQPLVEGAGRLLSKLLLHEVRVRGGVMVQVDTDGGFIVATPDGGRVDLRDLR